MLATGRSLTVAVLTRISWPMDSTSFRQQSHRESAAVTDFADDLQRAAVLFENGIRERQTQSDAASFGRAKRLADARQVFRLDSAARIGHSHFDLVLHVPCRERQSSAIGHRIAAIADQITED